MTPRQRAERLRRIERIARKLFGPAEPAPVATKSIEPPDDDDVGFVDKEAAAAPEIVYEVVSWRQAATSAAFESLGDYRGRW